MYVCVQFPRFFVQLFTKCVTMSPPQISTNITMSHVFVFFFSYNYLQNGCPNRSTPGHRGWDLIFLLFILLFPEENGVSSTWRWNLA